MKTFYEEITKFNSLVNPEKLSKYEKTIISEMDKAEIINIQNVADYYYEIDNKDEWNLFEDYPNLAPPFERFWMEYYFPKTLRCGNEIKLNQFADIRFGFLFCVQDVKITDKENFGKWAIEIFLFTKHKNSFFQSVSWRFFIDNLGKIQPFQNGSPIHIAGASTQEEANATIILLNPALLAISFMHCKNVETIAQEPKRITGKRTPRNQSKIKYHVLKIEPMKKILRDEGDSETRGIKHALHICRGHFKDFSNGEGLFGKYKGMYWWNSQVRGNTKHGIVNKDYSVMSPENNNDN